jgi:hypothetical protein
VFLAAELREAYTISLDRRELEIRRIVSSAETHLEVS